MLGLLDSFGCRSSRLCGHRIWVSTVFGNRSCSGQTPVTQGDVLTTVIAIFDTHRQTLALSLKLASDARGSDRTVSTILGNGGQSTVSVPTKTDFLGSHLGFSNEIYACITCYDAFSKPIGLGPIGLSIQ